MKLLIFTYAPAGLGHLRVTDALADAMPLGNPYYLLGSIDKFITWAHRFTSLNSFGKFIFLKSQYGIFEEIFTRGYRRFLVMTAGSLYKDVKKIIEENSQVEEVWVIATHFGMAHQIGSFKDRLMKETGKKIRLVVQVTDDTSQRIWCIWGADLTFVPSRHVQKEFEEYAARYNYKFVSEVIPYPLSPTLTAMIPKEKGSRSDVFKDNGEIRIAVPISGAMVGLAFVMELIMLLSKSGKKLQIWVLVKKSSMTKVFVSVLARIPGVIVVVGKNDAETVGLYELMYQENIIHLEITKPSEQAFKAILSPRRVGGSILLFTDPVGRQEIENIEFLRRHGLVAGIGAEIHKEKNGSSAPRAIKLPRNAGDAAKYIIHAIDSGVFEYMTSGFHFSEKSLESGEIGPLGAKKFWSVLEKKFEVK